VEWTDSWECTSALTSHELRTRETARETDVTQRMHSTLMQPTDTKAPIPSYSFSQSDIHISTDVVNPDVDIEPPGTHTLIKDNGLVWVYSRTGTCTGTIHPSTLTNLLYRYAPNTAANDPQTHKTRFAGMVHALVQTSYIRHSHPQTSGDSSPRYRLPRFLVTAIKHLGSSQV
jgi:hypothetical protein